MYCPNCGKEVADNVKYCPFCGTSVSAAADNSSDRSPEEDSPHLHREEDSSQESRSQQDASQESSTQNNDQAPPAPAYAPPQPSQQNNGSRSVYRYLSMAGGALFLVIAALSFLGIVIDLPHLLYSYNPLAFLLNAALRMVGTIGCLLLGIGAFFIGFHSKGDRFKSGQETTLFFTAVGGGALLLIQTVGAAALNLYPYYYYDSPAPVTIMLALMLIGGLYLLLSSEGAAPHISAGGKQFAAQVGGKAHTQSQQGNASYTPHQSFYVEDGGRYLHTDRSLLKYILLTLITLGLYSLFFLYRWVKEINIACAGDGKETAGLAKLIVWSVLTCGIYWWIWNYQLGNRLAENASRYGLQFQENGTTVLLWMLLGSMLCGIGPFVAMHILIQNTNTICAAYNNSIDK